MTIEIRQMVIRAVVERRPDAPPPQQSLFFAPPPARAAEPADRDALVAACVREVLRRLERTHER